MMHWTYLEILADLRAEELQRSAQLAELRSEAGGLRRVLAQGLVGLGRRIDADAWRDVVGAIEATPRLNGSDA